MTSSAVRPASLRPPAIFENTKTIWKNELPSFCSSVTLSGAFFMAHHLFIQSLNLSREWRIANYAVLAIFDSAYFMGHWGFISLVGRQNRGLQYDPNSRLMRMLNLFRGKAIGVATGMYQLFSLGLTLSKLLTLMTLDTLSAGILGFGTPFLTIGNIWATFIAPLELVHHENPSCNGGRLVCATTSTCGSTIPIMAFYVLSLLAAPITLGLSDEGFGWSNGVLDKSAIIAIALYNLTCLAQFTASLAHIAVRYTGYAPGNRYNYWVNTIFKGKLGHVMAPNFLQFFTTSNYTLLKDYVGVAWWLSLPIGGTIAAIATYHFSVNLMAGNPHGTQHQKAGLSAVLAAEALMVGGRRHSTGAAKAEPDTEAPPPAKTAAAVMEMTGAAAPQGAGLQHSL